MSYSTMNALRCRVPEMKNDDGTVVVSQFDVGRDSLENLRAQLGGGRGTRPGTYTRIDVDGRLWMSDTDAECRDHFAPIQKAKYASGAGWGVEPEDHTPTGRGLVNGLGLGCVVGAMLDWLDHVDVVEIDARVAELVGGWFETEYPGRVTIHVDDAYTIKWPTGTEWDVAWHDIWPSLCTDNLVGMGKLHRRYGRRVRWQGSWGKELLQARRRRERDMPWHR